MKSADSGASAHNEECTLLMLLGSLQMQIAASLTSSAADASALVTRQII
jgi:hypothetical protein